MQLNNLVAQSVGLVATLIALLSFQCKDSRKLFLLQLVSSIVWAVHFLLIAVWVGEKSAFTGVLLNVAGIVRGFFLYHGDKKWAASRVSLAAVMLLMVASGAATWNGWICILPTIAMTAGTPVMWTQNGKLLRWMQLLCISPFWLTYNAVTGSIAGIITESLNMISVIVSLIRYRNVNLDRFSSPE